MNKNQNLYCKFLSIIPFLSLLLLYPVHAQEDTKSNFFSNNEVSAQQRLQHADSLFDSQDYTEAYEVYKGIFDEQQSSPGMLLKMAYIQEGLGDFAEALYYLNLYYLQTSNKRVLVKMEELAKKNNLQGYEYTDTEWFLTFYYKYQLQLTLAILSLALFTFALIYYKKRKTNKRPVFAGIAYVVLLGVLYYLINDGSEYKKGIISTSNTYLMQGPSSGASLQEVVHKGHRVKIVGKEDVWVKINWNGKVVFVREGNIQPVNL